MARSPKPAAPESASYHGEVWTDARGYATVRLPAEAGPLEPPLEYELRDLEPQRQRPDNRGARERSLHDRDRSTPREGRLAT